MESAMPIIEARNVVKLGMDRNDRAEEDQRGRRAQPDDRGNDRHDAATIAPKATIITTNADGHADHFGLTARRLLFIAMLPLISTVNPALRAASAHRRRPCDRVGDLAEVLDRERHAEIGHRIGFGFI